MQGQGKDRNDGNEVLGNSYRCEMFIYLLATKNLENASKKKNITNAVIG